MIGVPWVKISDADQHRALSNSLILRFLLRSAHCVLRARLQGTPEVAVKSPLRHLLVPEPILLNRRRWGVSNRTCISHQCRMVPMTRTRHPQWMTDRACDFLSNHVSENPSLCQISGRLKAYTTKEYHLAESRN